MVDAPLRLMGLDPGSQRTGYGIIQAGDRSKPELVAAGVISAPAKQPMERRLQKIYRELREVIASHRPQEMAVEGVFAAKNARTAIMLGQARGVALLAGAQDGLEVFEYPPASVKMALVGTGRATKEQVQMMVKAMLNTTARLPLDASDALALAICHLQSRKLLAKGLK